MAIFATESNSSSCDTNHRRWWLKDTRLLLWFKIRKWLTLIATDWDKKKKAAFLGKHPITIFITIICTLPKSISLSISVSSVCFKQRTAAPATRGSTSATRSNKWGKALLANLANCSWKLVFQLEGEGDDSQLSVGRLVKCRYFIFRLGVDGLGIGEDWLLSLGAWKVQWQRISDTPEKCQPTFLWIERRKPTQRMNF